MKRLEKVQGSPHDEKCVWTWQRVVFIFHMSRRPKVKRTCPKFMGMAYGGDGPKPPAEYIIVLLLLLIYEA